MKRKLGVMSFMVLSGAAFAADEGIKVGGFVDAQFQWSKNKTTKPAKVANPATNRFLVNDGAIYVGKTWGNGAEVLVDLPFSSVGTTTAITPGLSKGQAFAKWQYENGFQWKMGQFDGLYGLEAQDTKDVVFSDQGLLYGYTPETHVGLDVGYAMSEMLNIHFLVADKQDTSNMPNSSPDLGVKVETKMDAATAGVGALFFPGRNAAGGSTGKRGYLVSATAGTKMAGVAADLELLFKKLGLGANEKTRWGAGLHLGYMVNEEVNFAARVEYTKLDKAKDMEVTVGPQYWMAKDFGIKLDYTYGDHKNTAANTASKDHTIALAALAKF